MTKDLSTELTKSLPSEVKRRQGIYFTPSKDVAFLVDTLLRTNRTFKTVLEPSCGSCEFVRYLDRKLTGLKIDAYETNPDIFKQISLLRFTNDVRLHNKDFLKTPVSKKYDLILGNPPFFETKNYEPNEFFKGVANVYLLFILHSLKKLNERGMLLFVLPSNFLTNMYCNELRKHIAKFYKVHMVHLFEESGYLDTAQDTCAILLERRTPSKATPFALELEDRVIFNTQRNVARMRALREEGSTLDKLGFKVTVGSVLWNEQKERLTDDADCARLIYSTDLVDNKVSMLRYNNPAKKNYIRQEGTNELAIVVNRGYGSNRYAFRFALVHMKNYLVENHLLVIRHAKLRNRYRLKKKLLKVYESFEDPRTREFISLYFKNNAMSTLELATVLPVFT
jgi:adenine-specific DNA-methyltransferase